MSRSKAFAAAADGKAVYPEVTSVPPPGAKLGDKVLNVGGIDGIGVSTTANVFMGTGIKPSVAKATSRFRG
mgnify:CR=1 FL=1